MSLGNYHQCYRYKNNFNRTIIWTIIYQKLDSLYEMGKFSDTCELPNRLKKTDKSEHNYNNKEIKSTTKY